MAGQFTSKYEIDPSKGFDASKLKGKSVIVTGGGGGLGEEFAKVFIKAGAFVTIGERSSEHGTRVASELGPNAAFHHCDVNIWSEQVALFKTALSHSPSKSIDIVVANAGISGADSVWVDDSEGADDEPKEPDLKILNTNLSSMMYTVKLAVHYFSRNKSEQGDRCLIMTASMASYVDQPGSPQYSAAKWGVRGLMRSLRRTQPAMGMRVNIMAPWYMATNMSSAEIQKKVVEKGVTFAEIADAGSAVLHLASDTSINGRCVAIVPRYTQQEGYIDMKKDDWAEDDDALQWQTGAMNASHRMGTK